MKIKLSVLLCTVTMCVALNGYAQSMVMMQMDSMHKNTFLLMMDTMMTKMTEVPSPVSVERDFYLQMIAHHEGALDMAHYEMAHGEDFSMIQLAKSIYAEQLVEIQQMKLWLKQPQERKTIPPDYRRDMPLTMTEMMTTMPSDTELLNTDSAFAMVMIPHHRAAVAMARVILKYSRDHQIASFAKQLISNEEIEIEQMSAYLN